MFRVYFCYYYRLHGLLYILKMAGIRVLGLPLTNKAFTSTAVFPIYVCTHIVIDCRVQIPSCNHFVFSSLVCPKEKKIKSAKNKKWKKVQNAKKCFCFSSIDCTITHTTLQPLCLLFSCLSQPWRPLRPDI